jgi:hypothetical protein
MTLRRGRALVVVRAQESCAHGEGGQQTCGKVDGLPTALSAHAEVLVGWIRKTAQADLATWSRHERVWPLIAGKELSPGAVAAVAKIAAEGTPAELNFLAGALAQCESFVMDQVELVTALVTALAGVPDEVRERALAGLRRCGDIEPGSTDTVSVIV